MNSIKELIQKIANSAYVEHKDVTKCGQCWKEKIKSEVANEMLKKGSFDDNSVSELFLEVDKRWQKTTLYLRVKSMTNSGKTLDQVREELQKEEIEI